jgi:nondiscriminating glutamyl-tRNA synthetase
LAALRAVRTEVERLSDLPAALAPLVRGGPAESEAARQALAMSHVRPLLEAAARAVETMTEWTGAAFRAALVRAGAAVGVRGRDLFLPVRVALTGREHGPELPLVAEALGREAVLERIRRTLVALGSGETGEA